VRVRRPRAKKSTANKRKEHNVDRYIQLLTTLSLTILVYRLAVVASEICEIPQNSLKIQTDTVKVIDLGVKSKRIRNFLVTLDIIFYSFRNIDAFGFKIVCFPTPQLFNAT